MSKTVVQTKKQQEQHQVLHLKNNNNPSVLETEEPDDTEEFYLQIFNRMKNIIDELDDRQTAATRKAMAYERALAKREGELQNELKARDSKITLLNKEVEYNRSKDSARKDSRQNVSQMVNQIFDIKESRNKKKLDEGIDELAEEILKKYR